MRNHRLLGSNQGRGREAHTTTDPEDTKHIHRHESGPGACSTKMASLKMRMRLSSPVR